MKNQRKTPESMIPDNENYFERHGQRIRKGTMAAAIANAEIIESETAFESDKKEAMETLKNLAPTLNAFGLNKYFYWRNPEIQAIFDEADENNRS